MKNIPNAMKFGTQSRSSSSLIINMIFEIADLEPKLKQVSISSFQENLVPKMKNIPNAMKFGTQSRSSSSLIINLIFEMADLDPKLKAWADLISKF